MGVILRLLAILIGVVVIIIGLMFGGYGILYFGFIGIAIVSLATREM